MGKRSLAIPSVIGLMWALLSTSPSLEAQLLIADAQVFTFHSATDHEIRATVALDTSAATSPVALVTLTDPAGSEAEMTPSGDGSYYFGRSYGLDPPPLGTATVTVVDELGASFVTTRELTNIVEEIPTLGFPREDSTFDDESPLFDWDDVSDDQPITYGLFLGRRSAGDKAVWELNGHAESEARFDFDGNTTEPLILGETYILEVTAVDPNGNASIDTVVFSFLETVPPIYLESDALRIELDGLRPRVVEYLWKSTGARLYGDPAPRPYLTAYIGGGEEFLMPTLVEVREDESSVCYRLRASSGEAPVGELDLCYRLSGETLLVGLENVVEEPGQRLLALHTPDLVSVRDSQSGAQLVDAAWQGRLIDVATAAPGSGDNLNLRDGGSWGRPLLAGAVYHDSLNATVAFDHADVELLYRIDELAEGGQSGAISAVFPHRFAPEGGGAAFIDVPNDPERPLAVDITLVADYDEDGDTDWIDSAKLLRARIPTTPDPLYTDSFVFKMGVEISGDMPGHLAVLEKIHYLTDGVPMHVYLLNVTPWPFSTLFGIADEVFPDFATHQQLLDGFRRAKEQYGAYLSFHDNYTDLFEGSPGYDASWRVLHADGEVLSNQTDMPGFETTFITNMSVYAQAGAPERMNRTLDRYPVEKSYHLDVLSVLFDRDYSPDHPTSAEESRRGIEEIVALFDARGVDLTSETLSVPLIESGMGWYLDTPRIFSQPLSFGNEEVIPLVEIVTHGKTLYGLFWDIYPSQLSPEEVAVYSVLDPLLLGANSAAHVSWGVTASPIDPQHTGLEIPSFYLIDLPWMALNRRLIDDYEVENSRHRVTYDEDTFVEVDYDADTYTVQVDGRVIAEDYTTIYPKSDDTFLIYSRESQQIEVQLPDSWPATGSALELRRLTESGPSGPLPFDLQGSTLSFDAEAHTPYKLVGSPPCVASESSLCLSESRFRVEVEWSDFQDASGTGQVVPAGSDDSGLYWFFDAENWEMLVKVLDGCSINNHFWVFAAATTNVEYTLSVTDTATGTSQSYFNALGNAADALTDTEAFATCSAPATRVGSQQGADTGSLVGVIVVPATAEGVRTAPNRARRAPPTERTRGVSRVVRRGSTAEGGPALCTSGPTAMCLNDSRFRVEVEWRDFAGQTGTGQVVPVGSDDSGLFWFFDAANWEMLVKVLNGCGLNGHFWVFAAATTNVEYTLRVTDSDTGAVIEYFNPLGNAAPAITDTEALAGCQ